MQLYCLACHQTFPVPADDSALLPPHRITPEIERGAMCAARFGEYV